MAEKEKSEKSEMDEINEKPALTHLKEFLKENWKIILSEIAATTLSVYLKRRKKKKNNRQ